LGFPHAYELTPPTNSSCVLVFVHGWLLSREYWKPLIEQLSGDYQCLSYDLRGFGESKACLSALVDRKLIDRKLIEKNKKPAEREALGHNGHETSRTESPSHPVPSFSSVSNLDDGLEHVQASCNGDDEQGRSSSSDTSKKLVQPGYTPADYGRDLVALLETLNIEKAWLVGHSLGGSIALWASDLAPERVEGVSCLNAGGGIYLKEEFEKFRSAGQQLIKFRPSWLCHLPFIDLMMNRMNVASPIDRKWGRQRVLDLVMAETEAALGSLMDSTTEEEVHKLPHVVSRLKQPVYFISGAKDDIMEPQYVNHLASFHSSFQYIGDNVIEIPDCGHLAMVECPDQVAEHLRNLLNRHGFGHNKNQNSAA
jgi:pimeloyl-ACP methyl ester carboxylesterase